VPHLSSLIRSSDRASLHGIGRKTCAPDAVDVEHLFYARFRVTAVTVRPTGITHAAGFNYTGAADGLLAKPSFSTGR
jgi:hypothetical protein